MLKQLGEGSHFLIFGTPCAQVDQQKLGGNFPFLFLFAWENNLEKDRNLSSPAVVISAQWGFP